MHAIVRAYAYMHICSWAAAPLLDNTLLMAAILSHISL